METLRTFARLVRAHKGLSSVGGVGLLGFLLDGLGRYQTSYGVVTWLYGPDWTMALILSSAPFKVLCLGLLGFALWRICHSATVGEDRREAARELERQRARNEMSALVRDATKFTRLQAKHLFLKQQWERLRDAAAMARQAKHDFEEYLNGEDSNLPKHRASLIKDEIGRFQTRVMNARMEAVLDPSFQLNAQGRPLDFRELNPTTHGTMIEAIDVRFVRQENQEFLAAAGGNLDRIQQEIDAIEMAARNRYGELAQVEAEMKSEMERLTNG